jgi:hypothetical protein
MRKHKVNVAGPRLATVHGSDYMQMIAAGILLGIWRRSPGWSAQAFRKMRFVQKSFILEVVRNEENFPNEL